VRTSSAKAKGRRLQNATARAIREAFPELETGDVRPAIMGESGEDIRLSPAARRVFPFSVECKNQERLNIWAALAQAEANAVDGAAPLLVFSRNRSGTYVALELGRFLALFVE
jgi:hypothetical protein